MMNQRGSAAVEFALSVPILLAILFGILDYAWYIKQATDVVHASREGLRLGVKIDQVDNPASATSTQTTAVLQAFGLDCESDLVCEITAVPTQVDGLDAIHLSVVVPYEPLVGMVPTPESLYADLTMALEDQS